MTEDLALRNALLTGLVIVFSIAAYHRLRAHASREPLDRKHEGLFILATLRPAALLMFAGLITYLTNPARMAWSSLALPGWLRWSGIALLGLDAALLTWTMHSLGKNLTDTVVTRRNHSLVTIGPYRWIRHPFYASVAFLITAISLASANWFLLVTGGAVLTLLVVRTKVEEEKLIARFGDRYRDYMRSTGRFFPRLRPTSLR
jgi:protein-S-isoprenylcysteine O-methyltransferase Ste14